MAASLSGIVRQRTGSAGPSPRSAPRAWTEAGGCEEWWLETQVLVDPGAKVRGTLRFLHAEARTVEAPDGTPLASLEVGGRLLLPWDEGRIREIELPGAPAGDSMAFAVPGEESMEEVRTNATS